MSAHASGGAADDASAQVDPDSIEHRILEGALRTLGRHGSGRLRMNAVSTAAGVARGTLYRYFPTKSDLFAALVEYERVRFAQALDQAIEAEPERPKLDLVLDFVLGYLQVHPALERLLQDEPEFVLRYLRRHFSFLRKQTLKAIGGTGDDVASSGVQEVDVAELVLRVLLANFLVAPDDHETVNRSLKLLIQGALVAPS